MPKEKLFSRKTHHWVRLIPPSKCKPSSYRIQDVGRKGGHVRVGCRRKDTGSWDTQAWRLPKDEYKVVGRQLKPKTLNAQKVYNRLTNNGKKKIVKKGKQDWQIKKK